MEIAITALVLGWLTWSPRARTADADAPPAPARPAAEQCSRLPSRPRPPKRSLRAPLRCSLSWRRACSRLSARGGCEPRVQTVRDCQDSRGPYALRDTSLRAPRPGPQRPGRTPGPVPIVRSAGPRRSRRRSYGSAASHVRRQAVPLSLELRSRACRAPPGEVRRRRPSVGVRGAHELLPLLLPT